MTRSTAETYMESETLRILTYERLNTKHGKAVWRAKYWKILIGCVRINEYMHTYVGQLPEENNPYGTKYRIEAPNDKLPSCSV